MHFNDDKEISKKMLPTGWSIATIVDLIANEGVFNDGDWIESKDQDPYGEIRLIQLADVGDGQYRNRSARYLTLAKAEELHCTFLKSDDILIARMPDPLGRACIFPGDEKKSVTVVDVCIIRLGLDSVNSRWLMYSINSPQFRTSIAELQSGTTRQRISRSNLAILKLPIPPLPEQHRIVAAIEQQFTRLDSAIASLKSAQAKVKQYRASLLKSAVEGEMTKEWRAEHPVEETGEQLLQRILIERRKRWEEAELAKMREKGTTPKDATWKLKYNEPQGPDVENLPELPQRWCWTNLGQCFEVHIGATPSRKQPEYWNGNIPWVSSGEVQFCHIQITKEHITEVGLKNSSTQINPIGSVLLGMIGEGKTRGQAAILDIEACNNQNCAAIWVSQTPIHSNYIYYWLWSQYEVTRQKGSGNSQQALNKSSVEEIVFPLPPLAEQEQIVLEVEAALSNIAKLEEATENNLKRAELDRQSILQEAFAGHLVPQGPEDEPASTLLERIREERKKREEAEKVVKVGRREMKMEVAKKRRTLKRSDGTPNIGLYETLVEAGKPMSPDELFKSVGLKTDDQPESTEVFYAEARADVNDALIAEIRPDYNQVLTEALEPSTEMLARMQTEEDAAKAEEAKLQGEKVERPTLWDI